MNWTIYHHKVTHKYYLILIYLYYFLFGGSVSMIYFCSFFIANCFYLALFSALLFAGSLLLVSLFSLAQYSFFNRSIDSIYILYDFFDKFRFKSIALFSSWQLSYLYCLSFPLLSFLIWDFFKLVFYWFIWSLALLVLS